MTRSIVRACSPVTHLDACQNEHSDLVGVGLTRRLDVRAISRARLLMPVTFLRCSEARRRLVPTPPPGVAGQVGRPGSPGWGCGSLGRS